LAGRRLTRLTAPKPLCEFNASGRRRNGADVVHVHAVVRKESYIPPMIVRCLVERKAKEVCKRGACSVVVTAARHSGAEGRIARR